MITFFQHRYAFWGFLAVTMALSVALRLGPTTPDVSWLITVCEGMLSGKTAYIDLFETTPPVPTLLYMPGVIASHVLPIRAEMAVYGFTYLSYFLALYITFQLLPKNLTGIGPSRWVIIAPASFFLLVLSHDAFAQREVFAAAFALPLVAVFIRHSQEDNWGSSRLRLMALILGGLSIAIKPPLFAAPGALLALYYIYETRSLRFIYSSGLAMAGAIGVLATIISLIVFPEYLGDMTTLMRDVYVPVREPLGVALKPVFAGAFGAVVASLIIFFSGTQNKPTIYLMIIAGSYMVIFFMQGKFFGYHAAPAAFYGILSFSVITVQKCRALIPSAHKNIITFVIYGGIACWLMGQTFTGLDDKNPAMKDLTWASALDRPTTMAISPFIGVGHPLARQIDAIWIDRIHSQWAAHYARLRLINDDLGAEETAHIQGYYDRELMRVRTLIEAQKPEIIIQYVAPNATWLNDAMIESAPNLLDDYTIIANEGVFRIWHRTAAPIAGSN